MNLFKKILFNGLYIIANGIFLFVISIDINSKFEKFIKKKYF